MSTRIWGSASDAGNLLACFMLLAMGASLALPCNANEKVQIAAKTALTNLTTRSLGKLYKVRDLTETSAERETVLKACVAGLHAIGDTKNAAKVAGELDGVDFLFAFTTECSGCNGEGSTQTPCSKCKGTGGCQNRKCDEGMVTHTGFDGRESSRKCPVCGGTAECNSCNGSGSVSVTCRKCRGTKLVVRKEKAKVSCRELLKRLSNPSLGGDEACQENGADAQDVCETTKNKTEKRLEAKEQEDANAMYKRGKCYDDGDGVQTNPVEAMKMLRKTAEQGNDGAQCNLGVYYANGVGVEQDSVEAAKWYRRAAEQGNAYAQFNLGVCYDIGAGVEQSSTEAAKWYRRAAEQGVAEAQFNLGNGFAEGCGVQKNYAEAAKWYRKAAEQGFAAAQYKLGRCYFLGYGVQEDSVEAVRWFRKAAEQGDKDAHCILKKIQGDER